MATHATWLIRLPDGADPHAWDDDWMLHADKVAELWWTHPHGRPPDWLDHSTGVWLDWGARLVPVTVADLPRLVAPPTPVDGHAEGVRAQEQLLAGLDPTGRYAVVWIEDLAPALAPGVPAPAADEDDADRDERPWRLWRLWRQDDHGNRFPMDVYARKADAEAARQTYDAKGHHQHYWVERDRWPRPTRPPARSLARVPSAVCRRCRRAAGPRGDGDDVTPGGPLRVWLDDDLVDRAAPDGWTHVVTAWEAIELLDTGRVVELSLDHDLGDDEQNGTGYTVVTWLAEQQGIHDRVLWPRDGITLHTANAAGRDRMAAGIEHEAGRRVDVRKSHTPGGKPVFRFAPR